MSSNSSCAITFILNYCSIIVEPYPGTPYLWPCVRHRETLIDPRLFLLGGLLKKININIRSSKKIMEFSLSPVTRFDSQKDWDFAIEIYFNRFVRGKDG